MAIAFKSSGAAAGTETSGAALNVVAPAVVDAIDILIAHVMHTGTTTAPSTPANWSLLFGPSNVGTTATARHWCFGKLAIGDEDGATISFGTAGGTNGRVGRIYSFSGYISGTLADVVPAASFSGIPHGTDPQGPSVTTTVVGALAAALTCQDDNNTEEAIAGATGSGGFTGVSWGGFLTFVDAALGPQGLHIDLQVAIPIGTTGTISGGAMVAANDEAGTIGFEIRPSAPSIAGTASPTDTRDTSSASGTVTVTGTAAVTDTRDTSSASGVVLVTGTAAPTDARDLAAITGQVTVAGDVAVTDGRDAAAASGLVTVLGSVAQTDTRDTASASGGVFSPITGTVAATDERDSASASGTVGVEEPPASVAGPFLLLTGEYPKPRRREPELPPLKLPRVPVPPRTAEIIPLPGLRLIIERDSPFRELIAGEMSLPPARRRRPEEEDEELAIALLLAA